MHGHDTRTPPFLFTIYEIYDQWDEFFLATLTLFSSNLKRIYVYPVKIIHVKICLVYLFMNIYAWNIFFLTVTFGQIVSFDLFPIRYIILKNPSSIIYSRRCKKLGAIITLWFHFEASNGKIPIIIWWIDLNDRLVIIMIYMLFHLYLLSSLLMRN